MTLKIFVVDAVDEKNAEKKARKVLPSNIEYRIDVKKIGKTRYMIYARTAKK